MENSSFWKGVSLLLFTTRLLRKLSEPDSKIREPERKRQLSGFRNDARICSLGESSSMLSGQLRHFGIVLRSASGSK